MTQISTLNQLAEQITIWAQEAGFQQVGIADTALESEAGRLHEWLARGYHGDMGWLQDNLDKRLNPGQLVEGSCRVISFRMDYMPADTQPITILKSADKAYVSRYALGRDYHKLIRKRLANIAKRIATAAEPLLANGSILQRPFVDSAPVLERPLAAKAGLGWIGKHTLLLNEQAGSWFFLGEIVTNIPLPTTNQLIEDQCGSCEACLKVCPTDAFPQPYVLDARRCISYLTIEHKGAIPEEFREPMGNRVFGCDDCQAICPWNKSAPYTQENDFSPRHQLDDSELADLFRWTETEYLSNTEGSAIRRIGYQKWLSNLAIGLGNADSSEKILSALSEKQNFSDANVREHVQWALHQHSTGPRRRRRKIKATSSTPGHSDT